MEANTKTLRSGRDSLVLLQESRGSPFGTPDSNPLVARPSSPPLLERQTWTRQGYTLSMNASNGNTRAASFGSQRHPVETFGSWGT